MRGVWLKKVGEWSVGDLPDRDVQPGDVLVGRWTPVQTRVHAPYWIGPRNWACAATMASCHVKSKPLKSTPGGSESPSEAITGSSL